MDNWTFFRSDRHGIWFRFRGYGLSLAWNVNLILPSSWRRHRWHRFGPLVWRMLLPADLQLTTPIDGPRDGADHASEKAQEANHARTAITKAMENVHKIQQQSDGGDVA